MGRPRRPAVPRGIETNTAPVHFTVAFSEEVYGRQATVAFVERLRDEIRFDRAEDLSTQIAKDVERTRLLLR